MLKVGERGSGTDLAVYMVDVEEMKDGSSLSESTKGWSIVVFQKEALLNLSLLTNRTHMSTSRSDWIRRNMEKDFD